ncbi:PadR family transcriptional regulator [Commensalibacter nepenthis]|uniref:PadR family transcriptional regulator n=1 Tax=Commensalibacter nepenthis TaxID=3043872 RepID=A0ABT6Q919_9PROT|nr:PadR family transcriptional regulator [Commensalibacter sp. TBRC 10068]MDI2113391.1 PadR family transcriptional regulator [Commensalibacter sp. TBRC 10068]
MKYHSRHHNLHHHNQHRFHHDDMNERHHHHYRKKHAFLSGGDHHLLTRGRKLTSEELQLLILKQLNTQPAHGYELIKFFEEHSNGMYTPSPGIIYPALTFLHETDKVSVEKQGNRKQYHITQEGKDSLEESKAQATLLWDKLASIGQHMNEVRDIFSDNPKKTKQSYQLYEARHALKIALRGKQNASEEELERIENILKKATEEILQNINEEHK